MVKANEEISQSQWTQYEDPVHQVTIAFPRPPVRMTFDLPFQNTPPTGKVTLLSVATKQGIYSYSVIGLKGTEKEPFSLKFFEQHFINDLIPRMFCYPQALIETYEIEFKESEKKHVFDFTITFTDELESRRIVGKTMKKGADFYVWFYLSPRMGADEESVAQFLNSFTTL